MLIQQGVPATSWSASLHGPRRCSPRSSHPRPAGVPLTDGGAISRTAGPQRGGPSGGGASGTASRTVTTGPYHLTSDDNRPESIAVPLPDGSGSCSTTNDGQPGTPCGTQLRVRWPGVGGIGLVLARVAHAHRVARRHGAARHHEPSLAEAITAGGPGPAACEPRGPGHRARAAPPPADAMARRAGVRAEPPPSRRRQARQARPRRGGPEATLRGSSPTPAHERAPPLTGMQGLGRDAVRPPDLELSPPRGPSPPRWSARLAGPTTTWSPEMLELAHIEGRLPLRRRHLGLAALAELPGPRSGAPSCSPRADGSPGRGPSPARSTVSACWSTRARVSQIISNLAQQRPAPHARRGAPCGYRCDHTDAEALTDRARTRAGRAGRDRERIFDRLVRPGRRPARATFPVAPALGPCHRPALARAPRRELRLPLPRGTTGTAAAGRFRLRLPAGHPGARGPAAGPSLPQHARQAALKRPANRINRRAILAISLG